MNILMPCKTRSDALRTAKSLLEPRGHRCTIVNWESNARIREMIADGSYDVVLASESAALSGVPENVRSIYLGTEFFCAARRMPLVQTCLIAHEDLSFEFITHGVRDTSVRVCGVPLRNELRRSFPRAECCRALGLRADKPVFLMIGETVSMSVLKSAVRAARSFCRDAQTILLGSSEARRKSWMSAFADDPDVFVSDVEMDLPLALSAADAVFTSALSEYVCAAARQGKVLTLLHSTVPRARRNAVFLDARAAAFHGKTAEDCVSYACRLLESERLHRNMRSAQEKAILSDAEERLVRIAES